MGTRTKRIQADRLQSELPAYVGKTVQVLTWAGATSAGTLLAVAEGQLELRDPGSVWYNRKKHTHRVLLEQVREVIVDEVAGW
ncbi:MAG: hypothetical protein NWR72_09135 [Bacteroidia bacterium]|nr:hypothetical protein [Bacteroidia bacterium]